METLYKTEKLPRGVYQFTINRVEKRNAFNYELMDALEMALNRALKDSTIRAFVITGAGNDAFCSGGDLQAFKHLKTETESFHMLSKMSGILQKLLMFPKPTIALLNGTAVGGGCELASACDFRLARAGIKAGFVQGKLAITTGWGGGSILLEKLPVGKGMQMLLEARLYDAEELKELGFIDFIYNNNPVAGLYSFINLRLDLEIDVLYAYKEMYINKLRSSDISARIEKEVKKCSLLWAKEAHHQKVNEFLQR